MKVKIFKIQSEFRSTLADKWEEQLNTFLYENPNVDIVITYIDSSIMEDNEGVVDRYYAIYTVVYKIVCKTR